MTHPDPALVAEPHLRTGLAHLAAGSLEDAMAAFEGGLASVGASAAGEGRDAQLTELHFRLGNACLLRGDLDRAADNYKAALRINQDLIACWSNLGNVYLKQSRAQDAISIYLHVLSRDPAHWPARTNLVEALVATRQFVIARAVLEELIAERPVEAKLHHQLGKVLFELGEKDPALGAFRRAAELDPADADSRYWIGGITQQAGDEQAAQQAYAEAARLQPLIRKPARKADADFCVLALYAPFGGNTPTELLFKDADYEVNTLALFSDRACDAAALRRDADLVINLISDADQAETADAMLTVAGDLVDRLGKVTLNHPRLIARTTREAVAGLLQGIPGCRVPRIVRCPAGSARTAAEIAPLLPSAFPLLARPAGTHGGDDFEKIENLDALVEFMDRFVDSDRYLIEYVDFRSTDKLFRKYRFIFIEDEVLPYHLAIGDEWKLHHDNTDMESHAWMQREEETFLTDPSTVFTPANFAALRSIRQALDLDYSGIDCALTPEGEVLVFEANASMLVHDHNERFPYKGPAVARIKQAFDAMLRRRAEAAGVLRSSITAAA